MRRKNEQVIGPSDGYDIENSATDRSIFFSPSRRERDESFTRYGVIIRRVLDEEKYKC